MPAHRKAAASPSRRDFIAGSATAIAAAGIATGCDPGAPEVPDPAPDVAGLTVSHFERAVGDSFSVQAPGEDRPRTARLLEVEHRGARYQPSWREPFSAYFRIEGAAELPQGLYVIEHPGTGRHTLFLVPVGRRKDALEAVFT